uniref:Peptidase domain-containing ABC transporter n=1 Tax=Roseihalotalea indica TaxID=2867963 RepID=A0AA49GK47_9BACT|nr:peptidase domain-containing ABC transporter [Tunicatimonas sp. TK19036]
MKQKYKYYRQLDYMDCGPTCLRMIAAHHGREFSLDYLRANSYITRSGVNLLGLSEAAEKLGFRTLAVKLTIDQLIEEAPLPCVLHWNQEHFVVLYGHKTGSILRKGDQFIIGDPGHNLVKIDRETLKKCWVSTDDGRGVALLLEPTAFFYKNEYEDAKPNTSGFKFLLKYLKPFRRYITQLLIGMTFASLLSLVFPFLTQSLVDHGVMRQNVGFIYLILFSQLLLFVGSIAIDMIKSWILLHVNTRISVTIISDFLLKLMRLPINFFETKNIGDITQRISDHHRIEKFLTGSTLSMFFSIINLVVFSVVLGIYNMNILLIFLVGSALSVVWIVLFLKQRKNLDYIRFQRQRENQNTIYELITGMQEIKLNNCERARRWEWERIQAKLFKVNIKGLALEQYQEVGSSFVTQLKNILISFVAAMAVINNEITIGMMLSISYIIGQMNGPLNQVISFVRTMQDAKISLERLSEIHNRPDEEVDQATTLGKTMPILGLDMNNEHQFNSDGASLASVGPGITLQNLSFRYGTPKSPLVLDDISLQIPEGKVTAIVGSSGSGKTTLLKLLLKFYDPTEGTILVNNADMRDLSAKEWRKKCGTVMQDGYIFSDTIATNIAVDGQRIDEERLMHAVHVANVQDYIRKLPLGFTTKIGNTGIGLSGGQRQRVFIARAVYKDPHYIFFDEATSALDANNERVIMNNLNHFFQGKTVVVIAHRLSTVKNADQIVVLEHGKVKEIGNHRQLVDQRGRYFELVKNQLELESA